MGDAGKIDACIDGFRLAGDDDMTLVAIDRELFLFRLGTRRYSLSLYYHSPTSSQFACRREERWGRASVHDEVARTISTVGGEQGDGVHGGEKRILLGYLLAYDDEDDDEE